MDKAMREKDFRQMVVDYAKYRNWLCYFTWRSDHSPAGFPDLVLVRDDRLVFAELKSANGRLSDSQKEWLGRLTLCAEVYLWRPSDWELITQTLDP